jgi:choline dehydrogenase-like flavoprotein
MPRRLILLTALTGASFTDPGLAWQFNTVPQANVNGRPIFFPRHVHTSYYIYENSRLMLVRGKMLGGSSGLNSMAWVRPRKEELDAWARLGIQGGWNWDGLLPYMMKSANVSLGDSSAFTGSIHPSGFNSLVEGRSGPIQVGYDNTFSGVQTPWLESFIKVGAILNQDPVRVMFYCCCGSYRLYCRTGQW